MIAASLPPVVAHGINLMFQHGTQPMFQMFQTLGHIPGLGGVFGSQAWRKMSPQTRMAAQLSNLQREQFSGKQGATWNDLNLPGSPPPVRTFRSGWGANSGRAEIQKAIIAAGRARGMSDAQTEATRRRETTPGTRRMATRETRLAIRPGARLPDVSASEFAATVLADSGNPEIDAYMSDKEIADLIGVADSTVRSRATRGQITRHTADDGSITFLASEVWAFAKTTIGAINDLICHMAENITA